MGHTLEKLSSVGIHRKPVFPKRFAVECCENFHFHWRNLRLEIAPEDFKKYLSANQAAKETHLQNGSPDQAFHLILGQESLSEPKPRAFTIELCKNIYPEYRATTAKDADFFDDPTFIHIHYGELRMEMSLDEFYALSGAIMAASEKLAASSNVKVDDLSAIFRKLNDAGIRYLVIRNWENLPDGVETGEHSDLDLLVADEDREKLIKTLEASKVHEDDTRYQYTVPVKKGYVTFFYADIRIVSDNYFPSHLAQRMLERRRLMKDLFYVPSDEDHFWSLLYHAVMHKGVIKEDYKRALMAIPASKRPDIDWDGFNRVKGYELLRKNGLDFVVPRDKSVYSNKILHQYKLSSRALRKIKRMLKKVFTGK